MNIEIARNLCEGFCLLVLKETGEGRRGAELLNDTLSPINLGFKGGGGWVGDR